MIDLTSGEAISLARAAKLCTWWGPNGVSRNTMLDWITKGNRGVKLEAVKLPKGWVTTLRAIQEFAEALTALGPQKNKKRRPTAQESAAILDAAGIGTRPPRRRKRCAS